MYSYIAYIALFSSFEDILICGVNNYLKKEINEKVRIQNIFKKSLILYEYNNKLKTTPRSRLKLNSEININIIVLKLPTTRREFIFKYKSHKNRFITDNNDC